MCYFGTCQVLHNLTSLSQQKLVDKNVHKFEASVALKKKKSLLMGKRLAVYVDESLAQGR